MIVLDTNVVSELFRPAPDQRVMAWVDSQPAERVHLAAVTVAEILYGLARLPEGARRRDLADRFEAMLAEDLGHRVLPFDEAAAVHCADILASRERAGRPAGLADAQIAGICRSHAATLATRNLADFDATGVALANPWQPTA